MEYIETWNLLQRLAAVALCAVPIFAFTAVIYSDIISAASDRERRRHSRYVHKGHDKDGTPIYLELPRK